MAYMAYGDGELVETIYGKSSKYEIFKTRPGFLDDSRKFVVYKDEEHWKRFQRLDDAMEAVDRDKNR